MTNVRKLTPQHRFDVEIPFRVRDTVTGEETLGSLSIFIDADSKEDAVRETCRMLARALEMDEDIAAGRGFSGDDK